MDKIFKFINSGSGLSNIAFVVGLGFYVFFFMPNTFIFEVANNKGAVEPVDSLACQSSDKTDQVGEQSMPEVSFERLLNLYGQQFQKYKLPDSGISIDEKASVSEGQESRHLFSLFENVTIDTSLSAKKHQSIIESLKRE